MKTIVRLAAATALFGAATAAQAAPVTFFGEDLSTTGAALTSHPNADAARASFFSNLTDVGTETFESFATGATAPITVTFPGAGTALLTGTGAVRSGTTSSRQYPISGTKFYDTNGTFALTFSSPISAFGFYGTDIGDIGATLVLTLTGSNGVSTLTVPDITGSKANANTLYYGFYDTAHTYTSISFAGAGSDIFGFDDFSIGSRASVTPTVPEPATWAMMLVGFGAAGVALRRRRQASAKVSFA